MLQSILLLVPRKGGVFHYMKMLDIIRLVYSLRQLWLVSYMVFFFFSIYCCFYSFTFESNLPFWYNLSDLHGNMLLFIHKQFFYLLEWLININYLLLGHHRMCGSVIFVALNQEGDLVSISRVHFVYVW